MKMKNRNIKLILSSKSISEIGNVLFDFANNTFLAGINPTTFSLVAVYQASESMIESYSIYLVGLLQIPSSEENHYWNKYFMWYRLCKFFHLFFKRKMADICSCINEDVILAFMMLFLDRPIKHLQKKL